MPQERWRDRAKRGGRRDAARVAGLARTRPLCGCGLVLVILLAWWIGESVRDYRDDIALAGKSSDPTPVTFTVAGETPHRAGQYRPLRLAHAAAERSSGSNLLLRWPGLDGFTDANADAFRDSSSLAPLIYVTIAPRDTPLDMDDRLSSVYARYFAGDPFAGPSGLTGRNMTADSGYGGEEVYFTPAPARSASRPAAWPRQAPRCRRPASATSISAADCRCSTASTASISATGRRWTAS